MATPTERRYRIGEVSAKTGIAIHLLRQWEDKIPHLKPKRDRANRRYYMQSDIDIARRINYLLRHEKMTIEGARLRLAQELYGEGRPKTRQETIDLLDKVQDEVRAMLGLLDPKPTAPKPPKPKQAWPPPRE